MRLHIDIRNERNGRKGTSDDTRILTEVYFKNKMVGTLGFYSIINDKVEGYRLVWKSDKTPILGLTIDEVEKGKSQNGEKLSRCCNTTIRYLDCDDCKQKGKICNEIICTKCGASC